MNKCLLLLLYLVFFYHCKPERKRPEEPAPASPTTQNTHRDSIPFLWEAANVYFMVTDRFHNGNPENDLNYDRTGATGPLRGFMGGDLVGITQKIEAGYFDSLGVNAIWFTPVVEQIHGATDEGTGNTYAYHGYWAKDWTALDPNFGTRADLQALVETAHSRGIRILMDVVLNHTGPVTPDDPAWPDDWVRLEPVCTFQDYETTTACTLVANLPELYWEVVQLVEKKKISYSDAEAIRSETRRNGSTRRCSWRMC